MKFFNRVAPYLLIAILPSLAGCPYGNGRHDDISGVNIGIGVSAYPDLVPVPGYPVYYDPRANSNYFFYDGLYWVYQVDNWYVSSWYNGPWQLVDREDVPAFVLRVPVHYYRHPPVYFRSWRADAPPHWGEHWGRDWEARRGGWDRWDARSAPPAAPLPDYQRQYSGNRYPRAIEQQRSIQTENYRYQPHETVTQQHFQPPGRPSSSRTEPQGRPPVEQRPSAQQQYVPQKQPRQQPQTREPLPTQPVHQTQPVRQAQPGHQPPSTQPPQTGPQYRGRERKIAPQDPAAKSGPALKEQDRKNESAPLDKSREKPNDERGRGSQ